MNDRINEIDTAENPLTEIAAIKLTAPSYRTFLVDWVWWYKAGTSAITEMLKDNYESENNSNRKVSLVIKLVYHTFLKTHEHKCYAR